MSQYAQIAWDEYHSFKDYVGITCNICNNTPETEEWVVNRSDPVRIYGHKQKKKKIVFCFRKWKFDEFNDNWWSEPL